MIWIVFENISKLISHLRQRINLSWTYVNKIFITNLKSVVFHIKMGGRNCGPPTLLVFDSNAVSGTEPKTICSLITETAVHPRHNHLCPLLHDSY
jgi:hypothetical protein